MKTYFVAVLTLAYCIAQALSYGFDSEGKDEVKLQGEDVTFRCVVEGLEDWQDVAWMNGTIIMFFNRKKSLRDDRITLVDADGNEGKAGDGNVYEMKINGVSVQDEGSYTCSISGEHPAQQTYSLVVNIPPRIQMVPDEQKMDVMLGDPVEVMCEVLDGKPSVVVTWIREDDAAVFENDEDHYVGETLSFAAVGKQHTGTYMCMASNGAGEDKTEKIKINVMYKPNVTVDDGIVHTGPGRTSEITCHFDANPEVRLSWKHDGLDINTAERTNIQQTEKNGRASLIISDVTEKDLGVYLCIGANDKGTAEDVVKLSAMPYGFKILSEVESKYSDSYYLEWQVESVAPLIECNLKVEEVNKSGEYFLGNNTIPAELNTMTQTYQITGLHANGTYNMEFDCRNSFGSTPTEKLEFYTSTQERPAPPPTTPTPVKEVEEKTEGMKEMNTLDENSKEITAATEDPGYIPMDKSVKDDPSNAAQKPVAMAVANLIVLLLSAMVTRWSW